MDKSQNMMFKESQVIRVSQAFAIIVLFFYGRTVEFFTTYFGLPFDLRFDESVSGAAAVFLIAWFERNYGRQQEQGSPETGGSTDSSDNPSRSV